MLSLNIVMRKIFYLILLLTATSVVFYCFLFNPEKRHISLDEKISQMIIIGYGDDKNFPVVLDNLRKNQISGVIFYKKNIKSPDDILSKISLINSVYSEYEPFIVLDQEGGQVSRISNTNGFKYYPAAETISLKYNLDEAYNLYFDMAKALKNSGFNFNLAPCVDLKMNEKSSIGKNKRSYGADFNKVSKYAEVFIQAHNDNHVITAIKHFPGLGSTPVDSHSQLPDITEYWNPDELMPFKILLKKFPHQPVMVGHVVNKKLDNQNISSLSASIISILSNQMGHQGIILMDAADMAAVDDIPAEKIISSAVNAGVNLFIFPNHSCSGSNSKQYMPPEKFHSIIKNLLINGEISEEQIDKSYKKIIYIKNYYKGDKKKYD